MYAQAYIDFIAFFDQPGRKPELEERAVEFAVVEPEAAALH